MRKKENKTEDQEPKKKARKKKSGTAEVANPKRSRKKKEEKSEDQSKCAERMHREFLAEKAKVIGPAKKNTSEKKKAEPVKYENGEYLKTPTNLSSLKKYVTTYFRAVGWTVQDKQLFDTRLRVRNLKIKKNKEDKSVDISFKAVYLGKNEMMTKLMSKSYTLENSSEVRRDIVRLLSQAKHNKYFQEEKAKHKKELEKLGWATIY